MCREEDESTGYVLPKAQLAMLAQEQPGAQTVVGGRGWERRLWVTVPSDAPAVPITENPRSPSSQAA